MTVRFLGPLGEGAVSEADWGRMPYTDHVRDKIGATQNQTARRVPSASAFGEDSALPEGAKGVPQI